MASSLLDSLTGLTGPSVVNTVAARLGEPSEAVSRGLNTGFSSILAGLVSKVSSGSGIQSIFDLIRNNTNVTRAADNPTELANSLSQTGATGGTSNAMGAGQQLLSYVFGGNSGGAANVIAQSSGMRQSSAASLLSFAAPLVLGVLGKRVASDGLSAGGLANLLNSEKDSIMRSAPAGINSLLGGFAGMGAGARDTAHTTASSVRDTDIPLTDRSAKGTGRAWLWPMLFVLAAVALFGWLARRNTGREMEASAAITADTLARMGDTAGGRMSGAATRAGEALGAAGETAASRIRDAARSAGAAVGAAAERLGAMVERRLPNGTTLNVPSNGIESRVISFIEDGSQPVSDTVWFNFDRLLFQTGSATLQEGSEEQIQNIANIMKAYPNVAIKIGGYTDNTGNAAANRRLSQQRANTVRQAIVAQGVTAERITAEGYGDAHPIASNDTEEGRALNRRIALRVTKK
jgi:OOP family OmpA-OmpF porin